jgi:hypothetical protein
VMRSYSNACSCEEEGGETGREEDDEDRRRQEAGREESCEEEIISSERSWGRLGRVAPLVERGAQRPLSIPPSSGTRAAGALAIALNAVAVSCARPHELSPGSKIFSASQSAFSRAARKR